MVVFFWKFDCLFHEDSQYTGVWTIVVYVIVKVYLSLNSEQIYST